MDTKPNLRDNKSSHDYQVLVGLLDEIDGREENDNDVKSKHHGKKLNLKGIKIETLDDNIGEPSQATGWQCGANSDQTITPGLRVREALDHLLFSEDAVLHSRLVGSNTLYHLALIIFAEALSPHRRIGHPPANEYTPEDGDDAVCYKQCLPRLDGLVGADKSEAIGEKSADDLLRSLIALV